MTAFAVTGADLHRAAGWAARCTPNRPSIPVLSGLLLDADDELTVTGWDFDVRGTATSPCTTTAPGRLLVSAHLLCAVAATLSRDVTVHVATDTGGGVQVRCGRSEWVLPALPLEDWPQPTEPTDPGGTVGTVDGAVLRDTLARVLPAVSRDGTMEALRGVRMEGGGDGLTLCATDRFRLATDVVPWTSAAPTAAVDVLVPGAVLDVMARAAGTAPVSLLCDDAGVGLSTATHLVTARRMAAEFPVWRRLVPQRDPDRHAVVDTAELAAAVAQVAVAAQAPHHLVLAFEAGEVVVSVVGNGRATVAVDCALHGDPVTIVCQAAWLRDALPGCGDTAEVHFGRTPSLPVMLCPAGDASSYRHLLVPVRDAAGPRSAA